MAKLVIGKAPKSFALPVKVPTPFGEDEVSFEAVHMRGTEWAKLREAHSAKVASAIDTIFSEAKKAAEKEYTAKNKNATVDDDARNAAIEDLVKPIPQSELQKLKSNFSAELLVKITSGWDLDDPFSEKALADMCDLYPSAADTVFQAYNETLEGLRVKN